MRGLKQRSGYIAMLVGGIALLLASCGGVKKEAGVAWQDETAHFYRTSQVDAGNVAKLGVAWEFRDFVVRGRTNRGVEATPIVVDGVMYTSGPWSVVYALDARTGKQLWQYDPETDGAYGRRACCDVVNRGVAVKDGTVYVATLDGYLVALDARTGKQKWKADTFIDRTRSYTITGAPSVAGDVVVIGNGGAELGVRGYVTALDRKTGKMAWRFFIVPGDPAAGPDEHPEVTEARKTWDPKSAWEFGGGGTAWDSIVYDPDTGIVYVGTGNGSPHPAWLRSPAGGDNLYLSSIVAIDARSGRKKWHYQTTPADSWDYTATQNMVLADLEIGGKPRKVIMQAPKNGFFYVLDRVNGELLSAEKYTTVTWADRVDLKTGRPVLSTQADFSKDPKLVWPSEAGGHNWQPMAYNDVTKLVYIPILETPMTFQTAASPYRPHTISQGSRTGLAGLAAPDDKELAPLLKGQPKPKFQQVLRAWDPVKQKVVWSSKPMPFWSGGVMATSNGLVMQGSADGFLTIYNAATGDVLRRIDIGTGIMAAPMTYEIDSEQYVAVAAGFGGALNAFYMPGFAAAKYENTPRILVFKLGGAQPAMPPLRASLPLIPAPARYRGTPAQVARGTDVFVKNCARCHGGPDTTGGYPDLWKMTPETHDAFEAIVLKGTFAYAGMASFADVLTKEDVRDLHAFLAQPPDKPAPTRVH